MAKEFDEKLRKAIQELQIQTITTNQRLAEIEHTKKLIDQNIKVSEIAKREVGQLSAQKIVYHNIGRVFIQRKQDEEIADQDKDIDLYRKKLVEIDKQSDYLKSNLSEMEKNVREILQGRNT